MVSARPWLLQRRLLCTEASSRNHHSRRQWSSVRQVTNSNFSDTLEDFKAHVSSSDFVALSLQKTGSFSAAWHRVSPFDTPHTAYLKSKYAAERFQILQFAACPFTVSASKVAAFPYNFHLFPRDELKIGMPSYSFSCHTSNLTSMAREGFDFNACIYDGISYLSRTQECAAKVQTRNPIPANDFVKSTSTPSAADAVFVQRIRSRVKSWKNVFKDSSTRTDEALVRSLRKLILGNEEYQSRPCMDIDVCTERQVELIVEMLQEFTDEVFPLIIPAKNGGTQAVRVVLTKSIEDKDILRREIEDLEEELNKKVRGFREVIELISASKKPVVSHHSLHDLTFIHSKFLAPLPPSVDEFMSSLRSTFPLVVDVNHLMNQIGSRRNVANIPVAISYLKNRFFAPVDTEIPSQATVNGGKNHGHNVMRICQLFAKLCYILKITPYSVQPDDKGMTSPLEAYANIFSPFSSEFQEPVDEDVRIWANNTRKVGCEDLVFLWGFRGRITAGTLKSLLQESHEVFSSEFDVRLVDESCAIVVFWQPGFSQTFMDVMKNGSEINGTLREMVSEGLRAASYETYKRACRLGLWETNLADSLDSAASATQGNSSLETEPLGSDGYRELMINLDDL